MNLKICTILAALWIGVGGSWAMDIVTTKGITYHEAEVKGVDRDGLRIAHRDGVTLVPFDDLPAAWQNRYGWTPEKAAALKAAKAAEAAQAEQRRAAALQAEQENQRLLAEQAQAQAVLEAETAEKEAATAAAAKSAQEHAKTAAETARIQHRNKTLAVAGLIYILPTLIGLRKRNGFAILALNLFLGWTFIGWVIALIWACMRDRENVIQHNTTHNYNFPQQPPVEADYTVDPPLKQIRVRDLPSEDNPRLPGNQPRLPPRG